MLRISNRRAFLRAAEREADAYAAGEAAVAAVQSLAVPVIALVARETLAPEQMPADYPVAEHNAAWREASARLAALAADGGEVRIVEGSDHMIPLAQPAQVDAAVRDLDRFLCRAQVTGG